MKWPSSLTIIRHGQSAYNATKKTKEAVRGYREFVERFDAEYAAAINPWWASITLRAMALELAPMITLPFSDFDTPLTSEGWQQAEATGVALRSSPMPHVVYVSPYLRTKQTLIGLINTWPQLADVKTLEDERIREQEHGLSGLFNDWRVFFALYPDQGFFKKQEGDYGYRWPNGESELDVRRRAHDMLATQVREHAGEDVLCISHHLTKLCIRAELERWNREKFIEADENEKPVNCGVTVYLGAPNVGKQGHLVLQTYNQQFY